MGGLGEGFKRIAPEVIKIGSQSVHASGGKTVKAAVALWGDDEQACVG
jgi:hypothetical protein